MATEIKKKISRKDFATYFPIPSDDSDKEDEFVADRSVYSPICNERLHSFECIENERKRKMKLYVVDGSDEEKDSDMKVTIGAKRGAVTKRPRRPRVVITIKKRKVFSDAMVQALKIWKQRSGNTTDETNSNPSAKWSGNGLAKSHPASTPLIDHSDKPEQRQDL